MQQKSTKLTSNSMNYFSKDGAGPAPSYNSGSNFSGYGQPIKQLDLRQSQNVNHQKSLHNSQSQTSAPKDGAVERLLLNNLEPEQYLRQQQFASEYQKQQKSIKNIYGGTTTVSTSQQLLKVPKLKLKTDLSSIDILGEKAAQGASTPSNGGGSLSYSTKVVRKQSIRIPGAATGKISQINSGRLATKNSGLLQTQKSASAISCNASNEQPKRSSSNKVVKQHNIIQSTINHQSNLVSLKKPQKSHKAQSKLRNIGRIPNSHSQNRGDTINSNTTSLQQQNSELINLKNAQNNINQGGLSSRQESADLLYFPKNQMSVGTAQSSNQAKSQHGLSVPMNSYTRPLPQQPEFRLGTHNVLANQTLHQPNRNQQQRHSAEPKLKNFNIQEQNLNKYTNGQEHGQVTQQFSKRALTGRLQDDEVVYVPHQRSSQLHDSEEFPTDAKSSKSLARVSPKNLIYQHQNAPQMVNNYVDEGVNLDDYSQQQNNELSPEFNQNRQEQNNNFHGDVPQFGRISQDIQKLKNGNMSMRELLQQAGIAVASLAKTSYLFKKQNKVYMELYEATEQECTPELKQHSNKTAISHVQLNQMIKLISIDINRINKNFNEVHFKMLENDDYLQSLISSFSSIQSSSKTLAHILQLQNNQYKQQKESKQIQDQLCGLLLENQRLKQLVKQEELQGQDRHTCQNIKIESLDEQLRDSRRDNMILIQKVEQASKKLQSREQQIKQLQQKNNALSKLLQSKQDDSLQRKPISGSYSQTSQCDLLHHEIESPQAVIYRTQIQKLVSQVQVFVEAMKNLQKLIGSKAIDGHGNVVPPDKVQVKMCKEKFEVSQKIMEQTIKQIKKENADVFQKDLATISALNEESNKLLLREKEKSNRHKKHIAELETNLLIEREKLQTNLHQNQILTIKIEDLEQQLRLRQSIQKFSQQTQTVRKLMIEQQVQAPAFLPRISSKETQTLRVAHRSSSVNTRTCQETILPLIPSQTDVLRNENVALQNQLERQECSLKILKDQLSTLTEQANLECKDCVYLQEKLEQIKEKDIETKYMKLQNEADDVKQKLQQLEQHTIPSLESQKQELLLQIDDLSESINSLKNQLKNKNQKEEELITVIQEQYQKQSEIMQNLEEAKQQKEGLAGKLTNDEKELERIQAELVSKLQENNQMTRAISLKDDELTNQKIQFQEASQAFQQQIKEMNDENKQIVNQKEKLQMNFDTEKHQLLNQIQNLQDNIKKLQLQQDATDEFIDNQRQIEDLQKLLNFQKQEQLKVQEEIRVIQSKYKQELGVIRENLKSENQHKIDELQEQNKQILNKQNEKYESKINELLQSIRGKDSQLQSQNQQLVQNKEDLNKKQAIIDQKVLQLENEIQQVTQQTELVSQKETQIQQNLLEIQQKDQELTEFQHQIEQKVLVIKEFQKEMDQKQSNIDEQLDQIDKNKQEIQLLKQQISQKETQMNDIKNDLDLKSQHIQNTGHQFEQQDDAIKQLKNEIIELNNKVRELESQTKQQEDVIQQLNNQNQDKDDQLSKIQADVNEKDDQIALLLNNLTIKDNQIQTIEDQNTQKNSTIQQLKNEFQQLKQKDAQLGVQLQEKDDQIETQHQKIFSLSKIVSDKDEKVSEKIDIVKEKENQIFELNVYIDKLKSEMQDSESIISKHQEALESNRDTMAMLRDQISKGIQKQKQQNQQISQLNKDIVNLKQDMVARDEQLTNKIKEERDAHEQAQESFKARVKELEGENNDKEQLVCEANKVIEEIGDQHHDIKAKFKHLIQIYIQNITQSELQSSYKGDDSSLSIDGCFEQIQDALENNLEKSIVSSKIRAKILTIDQLQKYKQLKQDPQVIQMLEESHQRVDFAHQMILENNNEVERIVNQLQNAQQKIAKYKNCVSDLKSKLQRTAKALGDKNLLLNDKQRHIEILANQVAVLNEEKSSISFGKGQEKQTQTEAICASNQQSDRNMLNYVNDIGVQVDTNNQDINILKSEIEQLKKQIKKKALVTNDSNRSEYLEQLEEENMELLQKLQKTEKELQDLRLKGQDSGSNNSRDNENIAAQIKTSKNIQIKIEDISEKMDSLNNRLAISLMDLAEKQVKPSIQKDDGQIKQQNCDNYNSQDQKDKVEETIDGFDKSNIQRKRDHVTQIRIELKEIHEEMIEYRAKLQKKENILYEKDLQTLKDDVQYFTAENYELTLKVKALVLKNNEQALKIKEIEKSQKQILQKSMVNLDMSSIILDAIEMQNRKSDHLDFFQQPFTIINQQSTAVPQVNEGVINEKAEKQDKDNSTLPEVTSLESLDNYQNASSNDKNLKNTNESKETNQNDNHLRLSRIERLIDQQQIQINQGDQMQQNIEILRKIHSDLKAHVQSLIKQKKMDLESNNQKTENSKQPFTDSAKTISVGDKNVPNNSLLSNDSSESDKSGILEHVKSTLGLYLRKVPLIDTSNDMMLNIIFSMLKFTDKEIAELDQARRLLPIYIIDKKQSKKVQKEQEAISKKNSLVNSQNSHSRDKSNSGSHPTGGSQPSQFKQQMIIQPTVVKSSNKLFDKMKQSFSGKIQGTQSANSSAQRQKEGSIIVQR